MDWIIGWNFYILTFLLYIISIKIWIIRIYELCAFYIYIYIFLAEYFSSLPIVVITIDLITKLQAKWFFSKLKSITPESFESRHFFDIRAAEPIHAYFLQTHFLQSISFNWPLWIARLYNAVPKSTYTILVIWKLWSFSVVPKRLRRS